MYSYLEKLLISLDLIDGYYFKSIKDILLHTQPILESKESFLASVFPDKETMEQVKDILRNTAR